MKLWKLEGIIISRHTYKQQVFVLAENEERARILAKRRALAKDWANPSLTSCVEVPLKTEMVLYAP